MILLSLLRIADQQLFDQELALARVRGGQLNAVVQLCRAGRWLAMTRDI